MESTTEKGIDLFSDELPSLGEIKKLSEAVHSSERNLIAFSERLEGNLSQGGTKAALAQGIGLFIVGRDAEAAARLAKAKDCKEKYLYLGYALRRIKEFEKAIESLDKSLEHGADALSVNLEKAATYREAGDSKSARKRLDGCRNFENVSAEYHYQLGRLEESEGLYEEAMENYRRALKLSGSHQGALFHLAYRCDLSGDEESAMEYYEQITSGSSVYVNALLNLAVLYEDKGEYIKASECVDKVLEHHPNHSRAILFKKDIESAKTMFYDEEKEKKKDLRSQILDTPISDFELSVRSRNCFKKMNIGTLGDLMNITEAELLSYKNFGETSLREIKVVLESKGLRLGMALEEKESVEGEGEEGDDGVDEAQEILNQPVEELNLSVRARKCLQKLSIRTLGELTKKTEAELLGCKNFGVTSLNEIKKALEGYGLELRTLE
ncbi:MAG TPA: DNA-directed RNA polymerase subunit alpha C-terminal domain-containing protein [Sedimentisphaerales bacterium]|nr:DNA-directed RNA polymerase subunit alpha C-terminal domain-containing protein [Sedimentisphaerales bacterium]